MKVWNQAAAMGLAQVKVSALGAAAGDSFALVEVETVETPGGWLFFYNSRAFLETGDAATALAGNGPILVTRGGAVHELPSAGDWVPGAGIP